WRVQRLEETVQGHLGRAFGPRLLGGDGGTVVGPQMNPVERNMIALDTRANQRADRVRQERAAVRHQQDDATAGVLALIELADRREQRATDVRIGKPAPRRARIDARLHYFIVLRERHYVHGTRAEEHQREPIVRPLAYEFAEQLARHAGFLRAA